MRAVQVAVIGLILIWTSSAYAVDERARDLDFAAAIEASYVDLQAARQDSIEREPASEEAETPKVLFLEIGTDI